MKNINIDIITWCTLLISLLIRLIYMPITTHSGLLYTYWDAQLIVYHHQLVVYQVEDGRTGLIVSFCNATVLAGDIIQLLQNGEFKKTLGGNGYMMMKNQM